MYTTRRIKPEDICYVTATCKNKDCQRAFMIQDSIKDGWYNDLPPTHLYCPECEAKGFKNKTVKKKKIAPQDFLKENKVTDPFVRKEFFKRCKGVTKPNYNKIYKQALEVGQYRREKYENR